MMKLKSNQTRTYDGDGYKKRAACLCFRNESEEEVSPRVRRENGPHEKTQVVLWHRFRDSRVVVNCQTDTIDIKIEGKGHRSKIDVKSTTPAFKMRNMYSL